MGPIVINPIVSLPRSMDWLDGSNDWDFGSYRDIYR